MPGTRTSRTAQGAAAPAVRDSAHDADELAASTPLAHADALARSAEECARQRERLGKLMRRDAGRAELSASVAIVDTCDLALEENVQAYESACTHGAINDESVRKVATMLWQAARDYLRRHSSAETASRQLRQHDSETLSDLHFTYEMEASALLALRHACGSYFKTRPDAQL